ncbi:MAG: putative Serine-type D-Ala-D-Ala carboxypeptidase [Candidatus Saccharibacteria bacterium]|nr:putative Serine-type D-Ala-D-Ala carboxypeptidase [Candidatus Saccharibacteria bacterium]
MLKLKVKKRRILLIVIAVALLVFGGVFGAVEYYGNQAIAKQQSESKDQLAKMDAKIIELKKKASEMKAKEEAEKKAAEQSASAEAALTAQQLGQIVTPIGCAIKGTHGNPSSIDVVINKKHCFNPIDFIPGDLTSFNGYVVSAKIVPDLTAMFNAAASAGVPLSMTSSYRSYANQVATYNNWVTVNGSTAAADTVSARPGYSEHQTGLAMDLSAGGCSLECFRSSAQYAWMQANAATYGFIERYPAGLESVTGYSPEAWHYRYIGPTTALEMKSKSIKTLEQLWNISGGGY